MLIPLADKNRAQPGQYLLTLVTVLGVALGCYLVKDLLGYRVAALLLLLAVSILAMICDILPVLIAAVGSALLWNFLFIPPELTFRIGNTEDLLLFLMYFVVAILNAVLTSRIRKAEYQARKQDEHRRTIALYNTVLNTLSHELRTPIATIIGATDTLREHGEKLTEASRTELLGEIETASLRLNREVVNLLDASRLESGFLHLSVDWCDVNELIHNVIRNHISGAGLRRILFSEDEGLPLFKLDRSLLEHALDNLLHNAIRYTPDRATIRFEATWKEHRCVITIADDGPGIPKEASARVFEKFHRLPDSLPGGIGLGLSIARGFVEAHGGTLTLSEDTVGTHFIISIPAEHSDTSLLHEEDAE